MAQPYVGEIRIFGGNFAIQGWALCNGALLSIAQNNALFNALGTTYGGDGTTTFGLPDLQCRVPVHQGQGPGLQNYVLGQKGGVETVTLIGGQLPSHTHTAVGSSASGVSGNPASNTWGKNLVQSFAASGSASMNSASTSMTGNNLPHDNMLNFVGITFIISLTGIFPSQG
jgi:microcystin-dependent protein